MEEDDKEYKKLEFEVQDEDALNMVCSSFGTPSDYVETIIEKVTGGDDDMEVFDGEPDTVTIYVDMDKWEEFEELHEEDDVEINGPEDALESMLQRVVKKFGMERNG